MRIAYIGQAKGTSLHRANALRRLGHLVTIIDPWEWLGYTKWMRRWLFFTGGIGVRHLVDRRLCHETKTSKPDLIWINQGEFLGPKCLKNLRVIQVPIINYINDDPFRIQNGRRFSHFRKAIQLYDLVALPREINIIEAQNLHAKKVIRIWLSADEIAQSPRILTQSELQLFSSEVVFIGTWMEERGPILIDLINRGIPLSIWGDNWQKACEWKRLKHYWRGPGLYDDKSYSAVILGAKICLGLLSKGNRDLHTHRSIEIPALGGLLCTERTTEHSILYEEGREAIFWTDAKECAASCRELLADDNERTEIAHRGHERAIHNNIFNEPVLSSILEAV